MPSAGSGSRVVRIRLAYKELYRVTGNKGRFRHAHCLEKGERDLWPSLPLSPISL